MWLSAFAVADAATYARMVAQAAQPQASDPVPKGGSPDPNQGDLPRQSELSDLAKAMKNCMDAWDAGTRMSKGEWQASCRRTLHEQPTIDGLGQQAQPNKKKP
jgi:hypothetical protein